MYDKTYMYSIEEVVASWPLTHITYGHTIIQLSQIERVSPLWLGNVSR